MSSPGILRQYLEDYAVRANAYHNSFIRDANGDPVMYFNQNGRYYTMEKAGDGTWKSTSNQVADPGIISLHPEDDRVYMARKRLVEFNADAVPTFTPAQTKKLDMPETSRAIPAAIRSSDGVIGRFLGRKEEGLD
jgi:hypothetical protein